LILSVIESKIMTENLFPRLKDLRLKAKPRPRTPPSSLEIPKGQGQNHVEDSYLCPMKYKSPFLMRDNQISGKACKAIKVMNCS